MKKIYKITAVAAMVAVAVVTAYNAQIDTKSLSEISMRNIEALAEGEADGCKFNLLRVCTVGHKDHIPYRNVYN